MSKTKDRLMFADDMFIDGRQQVFSVRTGDFIGYRDHDCEIDLPDPGPEQEPEKTINENQLTLF